MSYTPTEWESTDVVTATRMNALEQAVGDMNMSYTPNVWSDGDILSAEKMNALEQAVASGGGGSSDFSTAEVTIVNNASDSVSFNLALAMVISEGGMSATVGGVSSDRIGLEVVANAVLYNGGAAIELQSTDEYDFNIEVSGDIQGSGYSYFITGDCTITIS